MSFFVILCASLWVYLFRSRPHGKIGLLVTMGKALGRIRGFKRFGLIMLERAYDVHKTDPRLKPNGIWYVLQPLMFTYSALNQDAKARKVGLEFVSSLEKSYGYYSENVSEAVRRLVSILIRLEDLDQAAQLLEKYVGRFEQNPNANPLSHALMLDELASVKMFQGKMREAKTLYRECLSLLDTQGEEARAVKATCLDSLAAVYFEEGDSAQARSLISEAFELACSSLGQGHPATAMIREHLREARAVGE